jgi:FlgD Ig-like domain
MTDSPVIPPASSDDARPRRRALAVGLVALFGVGLAVFLAPFAFPTPPPIVTRFVTTKQFSPNGDGARDLARVAVRLSESSNVALEVQRGDGSRVKQLLNERRPPGWGVSLDWDGTADSGQPADDGSYVISLNATSGRKRFKTSRRVTLDRKPPPLGTVTVESAALSGPGDGQCRVAATALDRGGLEIEVASSADQPAVARFGPKGVAAGETTLWNWDGLRADGTAAPPGLYVVRAILRDVPRNRSEQTATCWVGHLIGAAIPARPTLGTKIGVSLTTPDGKPVAPTTRVQLALVRRTGTPGGTTPVLGGPVGAKAVGPLGTVRLQLPRKIAAAELWILATTDTGRALIPLRP